MDASEAIAFFQKMGSGMSEYLRDLVNQIALETKATEQPITPVAVKKWTPETTIGELRGSIDIFTGDNEYSRIIGPTATSHGFPYGLAVKRGTRWRGEPANIGPRPFDDWAYAEMDLKVQPMADELLDQYLAMW